jgi:hypothetical protein
MKTKMLILLCALLFIVSCTTDIQEVKPSEVKCYGNDPLVHTVYIGSDKKWHYFHYQKGKTGGHWKVKKEELKWKYEFPHGKGHQFIKRNEAGELEPIIIKKSERSVSANSDTAAAETE